MKQFKVLTTLSISTFKHCPKLNKIIENFQAKGSGDALVQRKIKAFLRIEQRTQCARIFSGQQRSTAAVDFPATVILKTAAISPNFPLSSIAFFFTPYALYNQSFVRIAKTSKRIHFTATPTSRLCGCRWPILASWNLEKTVTKGNEILISGLENVV